MKKYILTALFLAGFTAALGQVTIGSSAPAHASATLEMVSTTKGLLPPRMTTAQRNAIASPAAGLAIYNTTEKCLNFYNGNGWASACGEKLYSTSRSINYRLGGSSTDYAETMIQTSDGGYVMVGYTYSPTGGDVTLGTKGNSDIWIVKLNADGSKVWDKTYGGTNSDGARSVVQTNDGGYIVAGYTQSTNGIGSDVTTGTKGSYDYWIVKLNADGTKAWDKTYGGALDDRPDSIVQTNGGGYIVAGYTQSAAGAGSDLTVGSKGNYDIWIIKLNADGTKAWDKTYGATSYENVKSIVQTNDGGYIMEGVTASATGGDVTSGTKGSYDYWIVKLNADGSKAWDKTYGGTNADSALSIAQTNGGGYIVAGYTQSTAGAGSDVTLGTKGNSDIWIVKLNADGSKAWDKTYGGTNTDSALSIAQTNDGGYIVSGNTASANGVGSDVTSGTKGSNDVWIVKLNTDGTKAWDKTYGGTGTDSSSFIVQNADGGYAVAGNSADASAGTGDQVGLVSRGGNDIWIFTIDASGNMLAP